MSAQARDLDDSDAYVVTDAPGEPLPIVIASPHSGRDYSAEFLACSRLSLPALRRSEDSFVDELFEFAPSLGVPLLAARFPRAFCDVNRERWEMDPDMFAERLPAYCNVGSRRVAAGFGTIARVVANGSAIYRRKLRWDEAEARIRTCWEPYHAALGALIERARIRHGRCLLLDCHSMPDEPSPRNRPAAAFVLGDAHGNSCAPEIVASIERELRSTDLLVRRNDPYAGAYVTRHYGQPRSGVHVVQIEIARRLYMDEFDRCKREGFAPLQAALRRLVEMLARDLAG